MKKVLDEDKSCFVATMSSPDDYLKRLSDLGCNCEAEELYNIKDAEYIYDEVSGFELFTPTEKIKTGYLFKVL